MISCECTPTPSQYECSEWVFTPWLDDDGNQLEGFEECAAWQTDVAAAAATLWPLVASAVREKVSPPDEPPFETYARVQRDDGGALISWCWRQRPDGSEPTILTVVPRELLLHLPGGHCEFIQSEASDDASADDPDQWH